jgi:hypothetical protein
MPKKLDAFCPLPSMAILYRLWGIIPYVGALPPRPRLQNIEACLPFSNFCQGIFDGSGELTQNFSLLTIDGN